MVRQRFLKTSEVDYAYAKLNTQLFDPYNH